MRPVGDGAKRPMGKRADMSVQAITIALANLANFSNSKLTQSCLPAFCKWIGRQSAYFRALFGRYVIA